jgi:hypothetical protein
MQNCRDPFSFPCPLTWDGVDLLPVTKSQSVHEVNSRGWLDAYRDPCRLLQLLHAGTNVPEILWMNMHTNMAVATLAPQWVFGRHVYLQRSCCICGYSNKCTSEMSSCFLHQIEAWAMLPIQLLQLVSSASNKKPCPQSEAACTYLNRVVNTPRLQHTSLWHGRGASLDM